MQRLCTKLMSGIIAAKCMASQALFGAVTSGYTFQARPQYGHALMTTPIRLEIEHAEMAAQVPGAMINSAEISAEQSEYTRRSMWRQGPDSLLREPS